MIDYLTGEYLFFVKDHLGSIVKVMSQQGQIKQEIQYNEFGVVLSDTNPGFQPFGFAGGHYDHETGLVRFGARDYDAKLGRWLERDPIMFEGGDTNLYSYVGQDPVNKIDPSGLILPAVIAAVVFEVAFDFTTFINSYRETGSVKKAWDTVVSSSPLNNLTGVGVDIALGPVAPVVQPFLDPTMADTIIKMKQHKKKLESSCPEK